MSRKVPFTTSDILEHPRFLELAPDVQKKFLELLAEERINKRGDLKRSSNSFFIFRRDHAEQVKRQRQSNQTQSEGTHQADISTSPKEAWDRLTPAQKADYKEVYDEKREEYLQRFPKHKYRPMSNASWNSLTDEGKPRFWFDSVVQLCKMLLDPTLQWERLTVDAWIKTPGNQVYVNLDQPEHHEALSGTKRAGRHASRGSQSTDGTAPSKSDDRPRDASHPYDSGRTKGKTERQGKRSNDQIEAALKELKTVLLPLGPQSSNGSQRRLVLAWTQIATKKFTKLVYVEEEIPHHANQAIVDMMMKGQQDIRDDDNAIILKDYTNPRPQDRPTLPHFRGSAANTTVCPDTTNTPSPTTPCFTLSPSPDGVLGSDISESPLPTPVTGNGPVIPVPQASVAQLQSTHPLAPAPEYSFNTTQLQTPYDHATPSVAQNASTPSASQPLYPMASNGLQLTSAIPHSQPVNVPQAAQNARALSWPAPQALVAQFQLPHPQTPAPAPAPEYPFNPAQFQSPYDQATPSVAQDASTLSTSQPVYPMASNDFQLDYAISHSQPVNVPQAAQFASVQDSVAMDQYISVEYQGLAQGVDPSNQEQAFYYQGNWNNTYGDNMALALSGSATHHQESLQSAFESTNFAAQAQVPAPPANAPNSQVEENTEAYLILGGYYDIQN